MMMMMIMLIVCNRSTGGTTNGESSAEGSCVVVQLENRQTFDAETNMNIQTMIDDTVLDHLEIIICC